MEISLSNQLLFRAHICLYFFLIGTKSLTTIINSSTMFQTATSIVVKLNDNMNFTEISEVAATSDIGNIIISNDILYTILL